MTDELREAHEYLDRQGIRRRAAGQTLALEARIKQLSRHQYKAAYAKGQSGRKLWLTRQADGSYMLSLYRPEACKVHGTDHKDVYVKAGEPIGLRHLCAHGTRSVFVMDQDLDILESRQVRLHGSLDLV